MMANILYWMTQSYSTYLINHVTGDAKYSVLYAAAIRRVESYVLVMPNIRYWMWQSYTMSPMMTNILYWMVQSYSMS